MIVLNKKRITIIALSIFLSVSVFIYSVEKEDTIETVSLPVSGKTIVLDAGHRKTR